MKVNVHAAVQLFFLSIQREIAMYIIKTENCRDGSCKNDEKPFVLIKYGIVSEHFQYEYFYFWIFKTPPRGVGRSWLYCNARPTRGRGEASSLHSANVQKSV